jgi:hypothetical protein
MELIGGETQLHVVSPVLPPAWRHKILTADDSDANLAQALGALVRTVSSAGMEPEQLHNRAVNVYLSEQRRAKLPPGDERHEPWTAERFGACEHLIGSLRDVCSGMDAVRFVGCGILYEAKESFNNGYGRPDELLPLPFTRQQPHRRDWRTEPSNPLSRHWVVGGIWPLGKLLEELRAKHSSYVMALQSGSTSYSDAEAKLKFPRLRAAPGAEPQGWRGHIQNASVPAAALAAEVGTQLRSIFASDSDPISCYNEAVLTYSSRGSTWRPRERIEAWNILSYYHDFCLDHFSVRELVNRLLPGCEADFQNAYGTSFAALLPCPAAPFRPEDSEHQTGGRPLRPRGGSQLSDGRELIAVFHEHMSALVDANTRFVHWMRQDEWRKDVVAALGFDSAWTFRHDPDRFASLIWDRAQRRGSDAAAAATTPTAADAAADVAEVLGIHAAMIWDDTADKPAVRYNQAVQIYREKAAGWNGRWRSAAKHVLAYYEIHCGGHTKLRGFVTHLLPGHGADFDRGYGQRARVLPLPFAVHERTSGVSRTRGRSTA